MGIWWVDGAEMVRRRWRGGGAMVGRWWGDGGEMVAPVITEEALARLVRLLLLGRHLEGYRVRIRLRVDELGL